VDGRNILKKMSALLPNIALPKQFIVIEELPRMGSGKVDFRRVTEMMQTLLRAKNGD
jgi:acyl-[acyl-carrier-protein]-phospholipid O-acyltransferase/long-chain-fatty-acid--[acyl-carrier-protein] ligase